jgi:peptidoglycan hydrolase-like protein with peptidoglycan-binding domain
MLARVHTHLGCLLSPLDDRGGPTTVTIGASVGRKGLNLANDVRAVQTALNQLPCQFGGPNPKLAVDGDAGPNTKSAIDTFQLKQFGWNDGLIAPGGPTIAKLSELAGGFGKEAVPEPPSTDPDYEERLRFRLARAHAAMPFLKTAAMDALHTVQSAIEHVDNDFVTHIDHLGPRKAYTLADKYFDFASQAAAQTRAELQFIANMCRRVLSAIVVRLGEIHGAPFGPPLFAIDRTHSPFIAYSPRRTSPATKFQNSSHIYLCDRIDSEDSDRFRRILCHEMFHFVDDETDSHEIVDHGYGMDAMALAHKLRMHNADNYALFAIHATNGWIPSYF